MGDHIIGDKGNLVDSFSHQVNQDHYYIVDEYGAEYSIEDFLKKVKYGGVQGVDILMDITPPA